MSLRPYIDIDTDNLPVRFEFSFGIKTFNIEVHYNTVGDFFTVTIYDYNMNPIVIGEKMVINQPLWDTNSNSKLPIERIVPMDESGNETEITKDNFGKTVFLFLDVLSPEDLDRESGVLKNG
ncbi:phage baseplate plug protein [uncultured Fructobacillus sp.]|uniref:phage baseplate plug family protein n=1 Tax=uncultured Fructobacillus sp. TaxID=591942 RepID=UPI002597113C|nr:hypothetical protein [uncultured Fructobacillus sp.]